MGRHRCLRRAQPEGSAAIHRHFCALLDLKIIGKVFFLIFFVNALVQIVVRAEIMRADNIVLALRMEQRPPHVLLLHQTVVVDIIATISIVIAPSEHMSGSFADICAAGKKAAEAGAADGMIVVHRLHTMLQP